MNAQDRPAHLAVWTNPMRIVHLVGDLKLPRDPEQEGASGVVRAALEIARAQVRQGHEVSVAAVGWDKWEAWWHGVRLILLRAVPWAQIQMGHRTLDFRIHLPYTALTRRSRFDIVHGHLYNYMRFLRARVRVAHFHSDPFHSGNGAQSISLNTMDFHMIERNTQAQVAVSQFVAQQLERGFENLSRVHVVYNGVDAERFDPERYGQAREHLRAQWNVQADEVVFLYAGAIVPEKGVLHLAQAFARLCAQVPRVHLALAGSSTLWLQNLMAGDLAHSYECEVRAALERASQAGKVHFLKPVGVAAMPMMYAASEVVVVPSVWREPFPLVALEALASGRPVIASNTGGLPESVNATNGLLVSPGDEDALQAAMHTLAVDPARRQQLGLAGRAQALRFNWEAAARTLDTIYTGCMQKKGQP